MNAHQGISEHRLRYANESSAEPHQPSIEFAALSRAEDIYRLKPEWDALYQSAQRPLVNQSYEWNRCCWETLSLKGRRQLHCITGRLGGQLVLVWPLIVGREQGIWKVAKSLAAGTEYSSVLLNAAMDSETLISAALRVLRHTCRADYFAFHAVREDSPLYPVLVREGALCTAEEPAAYMSFEQHSTWDSFSRSLGSKYRAESKRTRRRLAELGHLSFSLTQNNEEYISQLEWIKKGKQSRMIVKNWQSTFYSTDQFWNVMANFIDYGHYDGWPCIFSLKLNDRVIAADWLMVNDYRIEGFASAFDEKYSKYAPGKLLKEEIAKWACERRIIYDFRTGNEVYKKTITNKHYTTKSFKVNNSLLGRLYFIIRRITLNTQDILNNMKK